MKHGTDNRKYHDRNDSLSRRKFLKKIASTSAVSLLGGKTFQGIWKAGPMTVYPPRYRRPNPYKNAQGKPLLVAVRGSSDFQQLLKTGIETIGGLDKLINDNQNVLIKPNFNNVDIFPAISSADSIAALAREVVSVTSGDVRVGDEGYHSSSQVYNHVQLEDALANTGAEPIRFSDTVQVRQSTWGVSKPSYQVYMDVYFTPIIINFACIKRHHTARMTAALKNNVGTILGPGASASRGYLHTLQGVDFLKEVAKIAGLINPELTIVDARSILTVGGPFSSSGQIVSGVDTVILSGDPVAVDHYCAQLLASHDSGFAASYINDTLSQAHDLGLGVQTLDDVEVIETTVTKVASEVTANPLKFELHQNYPNPFNTATKIMFRIQERKSVQLTIYDLKGRQVAILIDKHMSPGTHSIRWEGTGLPSGTYFYRLCVGDQMLTKSMILQK